MSVIFASQDCIQQDKLFGISIYEIIAQMVNSLCYEVTLLSSGNQSFSDQEFFCLEENSYTSPVIKKGGYIQSKQQLYNQPCYLYM